MRVLTISRRRWANGGKSKIVKDGFYHGELNDCVTALYVDESRQMCCLGFCMRQLGGFSIDDIRDLSTPNEMLPGSRSYKPAPKPGFPGHEVVKSIELTDEAKIIYKRIKAAGLGWMIHPNTKQDTKIITELVKVNDLNPSKITQKDRETKITALFAKKDIKVRFVA